MSFMFLQAYCSCSCRLIEVGHRFCGSASDTLQESLKLQCWSYFHAYHLARLEELRMHLENEGWARCPVKPTFRTLQLQVTITIYEVPSYRYWQYITYSRSTVTSRPVPPWEEAASPPLPPLPFSSSPPPPGRGPSHPTSYHPLTLRTPIWRKTLSCTGTKSRSRRMSIVRKGTAR